MRSARLLLAAALAFFAACRGAGQPPSGESAVVHAPSAARAAVEEPACIWFAEGVADVVAAFEQADDDADDALLARAEAALDRHHVAHGWGGWIDGKCPIPSTPAPVCDARALSLLIEAALAVDDERLEFEALKIAAALEHNGRATEALALRRDEGFSWDREWHERQMELSEQSAQAGRWEEAYYHASNYNPRTMCGNCAAGDQLRRDRAVVAYLQRLERWEDLRAVCRVGLANVWSGSPCFVEPLVDSYHREGRPDLIASELADLRASYGAFEDPEIDAALAHREILALPEDLAFLRLDELVSSRFHHEERVAELLAQAGPAGVRRWTEHLAARSPDWTYGDELLAQCLAETGDLELGETLQRWHAEEPSGPHKDDLTALLAAWRSALE